MPIYEYECDKCRKVHEIWQKISDPAATKCPECKKGKLTKLMSASGFELKGTGWYQSDYQRKSTSMPSKPDSKGDAKTESKGESKTESKSEGKSETPKSKGDGTDATAKAGEHKSNSPKAKKT